MPQKIQFNRAILTIIRPCPWLPWGMSNRNSHISALISSYSESPESTGTYYTSLERYFKREYNAVEIVASGFVVAEKIQEQLDRKSTRLNSSHQIISYAVFCLKKKKTTTIAAPPRRPTCATWSRARV